MVASGLMRLDGKTVLVTGASAGLGYAAALAFRELGANIVAVARRRERLEELCERIGPQAAFFAGDAAEEATAVGAVALATERFGAIDVLINNAGIGNYKKLADTSAAEYDEMLRANVRSGFVFSRAVVPGMIAAGSGQIVFVSSIAGLQGYAGEAVYCATKFAQVGFSQALDAELRPHGIKVGVFCPGGMKSEFALGKGRTEASIAASHMMDPAEAAQSLVSMCTQPAGVRVPQLVLRHMG